MKPRSLRHCLEKAAKVLVFIQKHTPNVNCTLDEDRGKDGCIIVDIDGTDTSRSEMINLGKDLESNSYRFTKRKSPWLGKITYLGKADDKPNVVLTHPMAKDRLAINEDTPEQSYSFANA
jgi:hypothetical protein